MWQLVGQFNEFQIFLGTWEYALLKHDINWHDNGFKVGPVLATDLEALS